MDNQSDIVIVEDHYIYSQAFLREGKTYFTGLIILDVSDIVSILWCHDQVFDRDHPANRSYETVDFSYNCKITLTNGKEYWLRCKTRSDFDKIKSLYLEAKSNFKKAVQDETFKILMANKLLDKNL